ncbi:MAG: hypothetical protein ACREP5_01405, partial [Candidatus Binatia bacterium]
MDVEIDETAWEQKHSEFDFDTREPVCRDAMDPEVKRLPFPNPTARHSNAVGEHVTAAECRLDGDREWRKGGVGLSDWRHKRK